MFKSFLLLFTITLSLHAIEIIQKPITFTSHRKALTLEYIQNHYGLHPKNIIIVPKIIVVHYTAIATLQGSFDAFNPEELPRSRSDIATKKASVNVSVAYLIDKNGTIYQLMPDNWMARHVIGLNYSSIGIENVGTLGTLTPAQLHANIALIKHLKKKYPQIDYLIGHLEYRRFEKSPLWLEKDPHYRTKKKDPGKLFMQAIRREVPHFKDIPRP